MPKFMCLIFEREGDNPRPGEPEWQALWDAYVALDEEAKAAGVLVDSQPFAPAATAVTLSSGPAGPQARRGPALAASESLTGYYLFECAGEEDALRWAARIPAARTGLVEVRAIFEGPVS